MHAATKLNHIKEVFAFGSPNNASLISRIRKIRCCPSYSSIPYLNVHEDPFVNNSLAITEAFSKHFSSAMKMDFYQIPARLSRSTKPAFPNFELSPFELAKKFHF